MEYPNNFQIQNTTTSDIKQIANGFNDFCLDVGPSLAKEIVKSGHHPKTINVANSMFMRGVDEEEIMDIVTSFNSKKPTD